MQINSVKNSSGNQFSEDHQGRCSSISYFIPEVKQEQRSMGTSPHLQHRINFCQGEMVMRDSLASDTSSIRVTTMMTTPIADSTETGL